MDDWPRIHTGPARRVATGCDGDGRLFIATVTADRAQQTLRVEPGPPGSDTGDSLTLTMGGILDVRLISDGDGRLVAIWNGYAGVGGPPGAQLYWSGRDGPGRWTPVKPIASPFGSALFPVVERDRLGRIWCAYQSTATGKHHIFITWLSEGEWAFGQRISDGDGHCFAPSMCPFDSGMRIAWDGRIDGRYGVWMRELDSESDLSRREPQAVVADADTLLANPTIVALDHERSIVFYERAQDGWGRPNLVGRGDRASMTDGNYLLARRTLHGAMIGPEGAAPLTDNLADLFDATIPSPTRTAPRAAVDDSGALWLTWRQILSLADAPRETGFVQAISVCCDGTWAEPAVLDGSGGASGMAAQLTADPAGGVLLTYLGRSEGHYTAQVLSLPTAGGECRVRTGPFEPMETCDFDDAAPPTLVTLGDPFSSPRLLFGDLHRHSDLSDCRWWIEGSPADAYRYALAAAELDFLAITDHSWAMATPDTCAEGFDLARAYNMPGVFTALCGYEASFFDGTGHMVVLTDQQLTDVPQHATRSELYEQLRATDAITIAHHTGDPQYGTNWDGHDDQIGPLAEIYQPYRTCFEAPGCPVPRTGWADAGNVALDAGSLLAAWKRGLKLGVVASSDHLSTSGAYACVWADGNTRTAIGDALRRRRCYGATAKIELAFWADDHIMGESFSVDGDTPSVTFHIRCRGTGPIDRIDLLADGDIVHTFSPEGRKKKLTCRTTLAISPGEHFYTLRLRQTDENMAWTSPIWITAEP